MEELKVGQDVLIDGKIAQVAGGREIADGGAGYFVIIDGEERFYYEDEMEESA